MNCYSRDIESMMNPENIFAILFVGILLLIPFGLGANLSRSFRRRKEADTLFSEIKYKLGRVVGYTKRKYDTENMGDYYMVIEYTSDQGERLWAEGDNCDKNALPINSEIQIMLHPRDKRSVRRAFTQDHTKMLAGIEKNVELFFNLIFTVMILGTVIYYKGYAAHVFIPLLLAYAAGLAFGAIFTGKTSDEKLRGLHIKHRNKRLIAAQAKGGIPCYLEE